MIQLLSAIGLKKVLETNTLSPLVKKLFPMPMSPKELYLRDDSSDFQAERVAVMGPFGLVLRLNGTAKEHASLIPIARELRTRPMMGVTFEEPLPGAFIMTGTSLFSGDDYQFLPATVRNFFTEDSRGPKAESFWDGQYVCYALSAEGEILLGNQSNCPEDIDRWEAESRNEQDKMVKKRLKNEDVYSVVDGYFIQLSPAASYHVLGLITTVDKILNPLTMEWVYRLGIQFHGDAMGVYIHPDQLIGEPKKGRRFRGKITLIGQKDPANQNMDAGIALY